MKWSIITILSVIFFSCSPKYIPVETNTNVRDSIVIKYYDSIRVIPIEKIVDIVRDYDTLLLETSIAKATAYVDTTTHTLKGTIENKQEVQYRYITETKTEYRDSIVYQAVPYEVEKIVKERYVPWYHKVLSAVGLISILLAAGYVTLKYIKIRFGL